MPESLSAALARKEMRLPDRLRMLDLTCGQRRLRPGSLKCKRWAIGSATRGNDRGQRESSSTSESYRRHRWQSSCRSIGIHRLAAACHESRITNRTPNESLSGIICFGVIFQGQTSHAQHIGWGVTHALARIQIQYLVPLIHAVFVFEKEEHARVRCLGKKHNRGTEAARTALEMARVIEALD